MTIQTAHPLDTEVYLGWGDVTLYQLVPPAGAVEFVAVSAISNPAPHTLVLPARSNGTVTDIRELAGVRSASHADALLALGYELAPDAPGGGIDDELDREENR